MVNLTLAERPSLNLRVMYGNQASGDGYQTGYDDGYEAGHDAGYEEGYDTATGEIEPKLDDIIDIQESLIGEDIGESADKLTIIAENEQRVFDAGKSAGYDSGYNSGYTSALDKFCPEFEESGEVVTVVPLKETPTTIVSHVSGSANGVTLEHCRQIFDKTNEAEQYYAYLRAASNQWCESSDSFSVRMPCEPNTTYYIFNKASKNSIFRAACVEIPNIPEADVVLGISQTPVFNLVQSTTNEMLTITTTENAKYLIVQMEQAVAQTVIQTLVVTDGITETHVDFGKTVSGGSFNWNTGVLTDGSGNITQLTPQTIEVFDGMNSYHSDTGDTTVSGRTDPIALLEALTDTILLMGSDI